MFNINSIREMQINKTLRFHSAPIKMTKIFFKSINVGLDVGKGEYLFTGRTANWYSHMEINVEIPQKPRNNRSSI